VTEDPAPHTAPGTQHPPSPRLRRAGSAPSTPQYYSYPALKPPVWTWEVPAYFFVGSAAGAAALIGAVARRAGGPDTIVRDARWIAAAGAALSPPLLISDLGRPERFLNMLRVFKLHSPMSVGAWTLVAFSTAAAASAFADLACRATNGRLPARVVADASGVLAAGAGVVLSTYTGVLLGATAIPVWSRNAVWLPPHFGASGLGSAVSMLELLGHHDRALNTIGIGTASAETALAARVEMHADPAMHAGRLSLAASVLSGPLPLLLRLLGGHSTAARRAAAVATIAGSILTRAAWVAAGKVPVGPITRSPRAP
jgi:formate-dependent nitrite reductase membrane component NrfD